MALTTPKRTTKSNATTATRGTQRSTYRVQDEDTVVLILGQTGAGKSTFINWAIGHDVASVGHGLDSHTTDIQPYLMTSDGDRRIVLVDTPGFNDTWMNDREIMGRIVEWLKNSCKPNMKFAGIIYLHEITQARTTPETNYMHPAKLSNPEASRHVILVTVKWSEVRSSIGQVREERLMDSWQKMAGGGSKIVRFLDSTESAHSIINMIQLTTVEVILKELVLSFGKLPSNLPDKKVRGGGFVSKLFGRLTWRG
ncbi:P-loop containing nucleoside triphosphate hydrolase protein [Lyophyllum atratum]|nr:P-loop containing nucleoside triphosphate hydrolase protein [Lyophyllum atratum]